MNCTEFQQWLETAAERRLSVRTEDAMAHANGCTNAECRTRWRQSLLLERALAGWRRVRPPVDLAERVARQWRSEASPGGRTGDVPTRGRRERSAAGTWSSTDSARPARGRVSTAAWPGIAVAAVLCAAVLSLTVSQPEPVLTAARQSHVVPVESVAAVPQGTDAAADPVLQDMGRSYVGLVQNATHAVTDVVVLTFGGGESLEEPSPAVHWVDRWRDELGPVRSEVDDAWDEFFKTFPESFPST